MVAKKELLENIINPVADRFSKAMTKAAGRAR